DADGDELGFRWALVSQPAGSAAILFNVQAVRPTIVPDVAGTYVVQLVATDGRAISEPDTVVLTTEKLAPTAVAGPDQRVPVGVSTEGENAVPIADAGADQDVRIGTAVMLDGSASIDAEHAPLTYGWSLIFRPFSSRATLADATTATPSFTADQPGPYLAQLV